MKIERKTKLRSILQGAPGQHRRKGHRQGEKREAEEEGVLQLQGGSAVNVIIIAAAEAEKRKCRQKRAKQKGRQGRRGRSGGREGTTRRRIVRKLPKTGNEDDVGVKQEGREGEINEDGAAGEEREREEGSEGGKQSKDEGTVRKKTARGKGRTT